MVRSEFISGYQFSLVVLRLWVLESPRELAKNGNFLGPVSRESDLMSELVLENMIVYQVPDSP